MKRKISALLEKFKLKYQKIDQKKLIIAIIILYGILLSIIIRYRFAVYDEKLFLHETVMMSEILKGGHWIGNYGVGVHGFIFKLPVALIFILTGPNIYIATLFHVILSMLTAWIFYRFLTENFKIGKWSIVAIIMLLTNYSFFSYSTTFHREIPVLFALMLFIYYLFKYQNRFLLHAFLLLLILEAKEYVFFALLLPISGYLFLLKYKDFKTLLSPLLFTLKGMTIMLIPSVIYFMLMFTTSIIPVNMFDASFFTLTTNADYQIINTTPEGALSDMSTYTNDNLAYKIIEEKTSLAPLASVLLLGLGYLEKLFYTTNFSFQGIPLIIIIISMASSIYLFIKWLKGNKKLLFLQLFYWGYFFIYMIRPSHQRYLLIVIPIAIIFFIYFFILTINKWKEFKKYFYVTMYLCMIVTAISILYQNFLDLRELFNIFGTFTVTALLVGVYFLKKHRKLVINLIVIFVVCASLFISSYALLTRNQIYKSKLWGINGEADKIAKLFNPEDVVFADCKSSDESEFTYLINIYRANNYLPIEWTWEIDRTVVRRKLDEVKIKEKFLYRITPEDMKTFRKYIKEFDINKILLLKSKVEGIEFPLEKYIDILKTKPWLKLDSVTQLKNKEIYIFVVDNEKV
jgi:hypothetical protein